MERSLISARLKLDWARHHLKRLKQDCGIFISREPYALSDAVQGQGEFADWLEVRLVVREHPPIQLALIAGDVIQTINAAMDHLVFALSDTKPRGTGFPVILDPDTYVRTTARKKVSDCDRLLAGVADDDRAIIHAYQPYEHRMEADPFWRMRVFANADKHRVTHPAFARPRNVRLEAPGCEIGMMPVDISGPLNDGALLFRFQVSCGGEPGAKVKVHSGLDLSIGFGPNAVDLVDLDEIIERADDLLRCF